MFAEKYRPRHLSEIIGHSIIVQRLQKFVIEKDKGEIPHAMFQGPPGTGKTTVALALINDLFGENSDYAYIELNASDERRIQDIREKVKGFANTKPLVSIPFKVCILDEADNMTPDSMQALRRIMEEFASNLRFIIIANQPDKIIEPLRSRCSVFKFPKLSPNEIKEFLSRICEGEDLVITPDGYDVIIEHSKGDLRKAANILQSCAETDKPIDRTIVESIVSEPSIESIQKILSSALNGNFLQAQNDLQKLVYDQGLTGQSVISKIHENLISFAFPENVKAEISILLGECAVNTYMGFNDQILLSSFLAKLSKIKFNGLPEAQKESAVIPPENSKPSWFDPKKRV